MHLRPVNLRLCLQFIILIIDYAIYLTSCPSCRKCCSSLLSFSLASSSLAASLFFWCLKENNREHEISGLNLNGFAGSQACT